MPISFEVFEIEELKKIKKNKYYESNKKEILLKAKIRHIKNKEKNNEYSKKWRKKNIDKIREYDKNRSLTSEQKNKRYKYMKEYTKGKSEYNRFLWLSFKNNFLKNKEIKCNYCGTTEGVFEVDHIEPRALKPDLTYIHSNLQILCKELCHRNKTKIDNLIIKEMKTL